MTEGPATEGSGPTITSKGAQMSTDFSGERPPLPKFEDGSRLLELNARPPTQITPEVSQGQW
jgi:hypothetical protein